MKALPCDLTPPQVFGRPVLDGRITVTFCPKISDIVKSGNFDQTCFIGLTVSDYSPILASTMALKTVKAVKRNLEMQSLYLEPEKAALLAELSAETRIPKAVLLREAVDDLLIRYKRLRPPKRKS
jgi:hypothetical protein